MKIYHSYKSYPDCPEATEISKGGSNLDVLLIILNTFFIFLGLVAVFSGDILVTLFGVLLIIISFYVTAFLISWHGNYIQREAEWEYVYRKTDMFSQLYSHDKSKELQDLITEYKQNKEILSNIKDDNYMKKVIETNNLNISLAECKNMIIGRDNYYREKIADIIVPKRNNFKYTCAQLRESRKNRLSHIKSFLSKQSANNKVGKGKTAPKDSNINQLKEYKEMLDAGLITQADYDRKKNQVLGIN